MSQINVTFAGGSVARRLGEAVDRLGTFSVSNKAVSGGGLLKPNSDGTRRCQLIDLNQFVNEKNLVIQVGGNDFFAHSKEGEHITSIKVFKDKYSRKHFTDALHNFLTKFSGGSVWIILLFPRYLHKCCNEHVDKNTLQTIEDLTLYVNIAIKKQVDYFHTKMGKSVFFLEPRLLHNMEDKAALSKDNLHLTDTANDICAKKLISCIEQQNTNHTVSRTDIFEK